ncbi:MAG: hypothetical protein GMKNLPBB_01201 [Myxococcota bacterium]|nr:hypothetical protein [Myxococcota bacterium]
MDASANRRKSLAIALRLEGFFVHEAVTSSHALQIIEHMRPAALILDVTYPGVRAGEFLEQAFSVRKGLRILLTASCPLLAEQHQQLNQFPFRWIDPMDSVSTIREELAAQVWL